MLIRGALIGLASGALIGLACCLLSYSAWAAFAIFQLSNNVIPTADVVCDITTGNCTGTGGGSSLFTAATCNGDGVTDDAAAFRSFNSWAINTWQASHTGLIQLNIPSGKTCQFISGNVNNNSWGKNILRSQTVGYGATINDNGGTGGGFFLGCGSCGVQFNGTDSTVRLATVTAGSSSVTLLDTAKCSLFAAGDVVLITGIDTQGFGDPPNPDRFEWVTISSTASCAGSGVVTLTTPLVYTYKSTWPLYNAGVPGLNSDQGGPGTMYKLAGTWNSSHAYYGLNIDQSSAQTNANGQTVALYDISCPSTYCVIPSQNQTFTVTNLTAPNATTETDKIVQRAIYNNITVRRFFVQSAEITDWSCNNCTISPIGVSGTTKTTSFTNSTLASLTLGALCCGASGAVTLTNTTVTDFADAISAANLSNINTRGIWASGTLTVPKNMSISSAANNGSGLIRLTVASTAGWTTGVSGDGPSGTNCQGHFVVTVIDSTHVDLQGSTYVGTCTGTFGSLPMGMMVPGANIYFKVGSHGAPEGPMLQVNDLSVGVNNETIISFNQNGSPYAGGFPTMPAGAVTVYAHPAPSFKCTNCAGSVQITDLNSAPTGPFGSEATRTVTSTNTSSDLPMWVFGVMSEFDLNVDVACSGASNLGLAQVSFTSIQGSTSFGSLTATANSTLTGARVVTPTGASGAQSGDALTPPGAGTTLLTGQSIPYYSNRPNCSTASSTVTLKTSQGVVYP